eukprot:TRINITY_DN14997_c0_g1_i1.p1 TRINITY_DN14997_c0_g1~~TRINITY_DN14997_c0_g1_i1.p1  ORF type:complete len:677 (+),score=70.52 TRINITY_DN14997_c0_g1_i1:64-2094(+)
MVFRRLKQKQKRSECQDSQSAPPDCIWGQPLSGAKADLRKFIVNSITAAHEDSYKWGCDFRGLRQFMRQQEQGRVTIIKCFVKDVLPALLTEVGIDDDSPRLLSQETMDERERDPATNLPYVVVEPLPSEIVKIKEIVLTDNTGAVFDLSTFSIKLRSVRQVKNEFYIETSSTGLSSPCILIDLTNSPRPPAMLSLILGKYSSLSSWSIEGLSAGRWYSIPVPVTSKFQLPFSKLRLTFEHCRGKVSLNSVFIQNLVSFFRNRPRSNLIILTRNRYIPTYVKDIRQANQSASIPLSEDVCYYPQLHLLQCCMLLLSNPLACCVVLPVPILDIFLTHATVGMLNDEWFLTQVEPALHQAYGSFLHRLDDCEARRLYDMIQTSNPQKWLLSLSEDCCAGQNVYRPEYLFSVAECPLEFQSNVKLSLCMKVLQRAVDAIELTRVEHGSLLNIILRWMYSVHVLMQKPIKAPFELNIISERWPDAPQSGETWEKCCRGLITSTDVKSESQHVLLVALTTTISEVLRQERQQCCLMGFNDLPSSAIMLIVYFFGIPRARNVFMNDLLVNADNKAVVVEAARLVLTQLVIHVLAFSGKNCVLISHPDFNLLYFNIAILLQDLHGKGSRRSFPSPSSFNVSTVALPNPYIIEHANTYYKVSAVQRVPSTSNIIKRSKPCQSLG